MSKKKSKPTTRDMQKFMSAYRRVHPLIETEE